MDWILTLHGEVRWLVALVGGAAAIRCAYGWARGADHRGLDRGLMAAFTGLLDLNFLLGLVVFVMLGGFTAARLEHVVTMLLAVTAAHASAAWRRSEDAALKFRNNLIVLVAALAMVAVGVIRLRGGWIF